MTSINYEKYSNMSERQLLNSLINAEKKEAKIKADMEKKLSETKDLINFLKVRLRESLKLDDLLKFYDFNESKIAKEIQKWKNENPQEAEEIRKELQEEMQGYSLES